jgi:hypothetical protein
MIEIINYCITLDKFKKKPDYFSFINYLPHYHELTYKETKILDELILYYLTYIINYDRLYFKTILEISFVKKLLKIDGSLLELINDELKDNNDLINIAFNQDVCNIQFISEDNPSYYNYLKLYLKEYGNEYIYLQDNKYIYDKEIILSSIESYPHIIQDIPVQILYNNIDIIEKAIIYDESCITYINIDYLLKLYSYYDILKLIIQNYKILYYLLDSDIINLFSDGRIFVFIKYIEEYNFFMYIIMFLINYFPTEIITYMVFIKTIPQKEIEPMK